MQGTYGFTWSNGPGDDLVIEAGFDQDVFSIQLILLDNSLTNPYTTMLEDWVELESSEWGYINDLTCSHSDFAGIGRIAVLDFEADIVGAYIVNEPMLVNNSERMNDLDARIFPNPTQDEITIELAVPTNGLVRLLDLFGKEVFTTPLTSTSPTDSLANLASGTYLLTVQTDSGMLVERVVKQ